MKRHLPWLLIACALLALGLGWLLPRMTAGPDIPVAQASAQHLAHHEQAEAGLCPWRTPETDLQQFFPTATGSRDETLILSGLRPELTRRLGRAPTGEEHALKIHRVLCQQMPLGVIVTRRLRGESGVIELMLAVGAEGRVIGARLQRLREPDAVAQFLQSPVWLNAFRGKTARSDWQIGQDLPAVPPPTRISAEAIVEGARTILILLDISGHAGGAIGLTHP